MTLMDRLAVGDVILMDGAMGTELERRGAPMDQKGWSAVALDSHPAMVRAIHEDYLRAGAELQIVHSFPTNRQVLEEVGLGNRVADLNQRAVALCRDAIAAVGDAAVTAPLLAGSVSNFAAGGDRRNLPDGAQLRANFAEQADILAAAGVDAIALEMLSDVTVSVAAIEAALATGLPVLIGVTCDWAEDRQTVVTRAHQMRALPAPVSLDSVLPDLLAAVPAAAPAILAIMHCDLDVTGPALAVAKRHWQGPLAAYPNSGSFAPPHWQFEDICTPEAFVAGAVDWVAQGAQIVGGCCGIGPDHIAALHRRLAA